MNCRKVVQFTATIKKVRGHFMEILTISFRERLFYSSYTLGEVVFLHLVNI